MYYLTKFNGVIERDFWVVPKITSVILCKTIDNINYSAFICHFGSGKCGNEGKNYKNLNISRMKIAFYMKYKTFFIIFEGFHFIKNIKKINKNSGHRL